MEKKAGVIAGVLRAHRMRAKIVCLGNNNGRPLESSKELASRKARQEKKKKNASVEGSATIVIRGPFFVR